MKIEERTPPQYQDATFPDGTPYQKRINGWIEGRFEMTMIHDICQDTIKVTNGKFALPLYFNDQGSVSGKF